MKKRKVSAEELTEMESSLKQFKELDTGSINHEELLLDSYCFSTSNHLQQQDYNDNWMGTDAPEMIEA